MPPHSASAKVRKERKQDTDPHFKEKRRVRDPIGVKVGTSRDVLMTMLWEENKGIPSVQQHTR
jgi:hypothetical protein